MKKVLILLLVLALMGSIMAVHTLAVAAPTVEIAVSDHIAEDGTVIVTVRVNDAAAVRGIAVVPAYDASAFELVSGTWLVPGLLADFSVENGDGVIAFENPTDLNEPIFSYTLKVKPTAKTGTKDVGCDVVLSDASYQSTTLSGSAAVEIPYGCIYGDANGDGNVDTTDAKLVMQYDLGLIGADAVNLTAMDVNGDGQIDTTDAKLIMQYDLGLITQFPNGQ